VLARDAGDLPRLAMAVADWLRAWGRATVSTAVATSAVLDELLLDPLEQVATALPMPPAYRDALHRLAARLEGHELVLTAAHNDLTMANVLDAGDGIGVVDWEEAAAAGLPLGDLWYSLADAIAHAHGLTHAEAVEALVRRVPEIPATLAGAPASLSAELSLSRDQALLGFHACWLAHAAGELGRGRPDGPFLAVVRQVAAARLLWPDRDEPSPR
jgi:thiamine kinase-like enzyme